MQRKLELYATQYISPYLYPRDKQYKRLLKTSGRSKKIPASVWIYVRDVLKARTEQGKKSIVWWDGNRVSDIRVQNEMSRYRQRVGCISSDSTLILSSSIVFILLILTNLDPALFRIMIQSPHISPNSQIHCSAHGPSNSDLPNEESSSPEGPFDVSFSPLIPPSQSTSFQYHPWVEWDELSVRSDVQSEHDFGDPSVLCRLERLLKGIAIHGNECSALTGISSLDPFVLLKPRSFQSNMIAP